MTVVGAIEAETVTLAALCNVGPATLADFHLLGVKTVADLATRNADEMYRRLCQLTHSRHDPCVHDVFSATVHQARTGEALAWWAFTAARKERTKKGSLKLERAFTPA